MNGVTGCFGLFVSHWVNFWRPPWSSHCFSAALFVFSAAWYPLWSVLNDARLSPISVLTLCLQ